MLWIYFSQLKLLVVRLRYCVFWRVLTIVLSKLDSTHPEDWGSMFLRNFTTYITKRVTTQKNAFHIKLYFLWNYFGIQNAYRTMFSLHATQRCRRSCRIGTALLQSLNTVQNYILYCLNCKPGFEFVIYQGDKHYEYGILWCDTV
jgi:hypothetical protein